MYAKTKNTRKRTVEAGFAKTTCQTDGRVAQVTLNAGTVDSFGVERDVISLRMSPEEARGLASRLTTSALDAEILLQKEQTAASHMGFERTLAGATASVAVLGTGKFSRG